MVYKQTCWIQMAEYRLLIGQNSWTTAKSCVYFLEKLPKEEGFNWKNDLANNTDTQESVVCLKVKKQKFVCQWSFSLHRIYFFNFYLTVPLPTLSHSHGDSLTDLMLITAFVRVWPEGDRELPNEVGSLSPAERLVGFEPGTFRFL